MNINGGIEHLELHELLQEHKHLKIDGWSLGVDGDVVWLTNPYGNDVGFYAHNAAGCERIVQRMASEDKEERVRGTL